MTSRREILCRCERVGSTPLEIDQHDIPVFLYALQHDLTAIWRNVEISNVEVGREVGQLALRSRLQIDEPEILVLYLAAHDDK